MPIRSILHPFMLCAAIGLSSVSCLAAEERAPKAHRFEDAMQVSAFGERPAFSSDGKRIAFIGKSYGDAYEIEIATGRIRNLTAHLPSRGFLRVHYLANGDFLLTGPRVYVGQASRVDVEMWVLDKNLERGLQPLGQQSWEGIAVSKRQNRIAWATFEPRLSPKSGDRWESFLGKATLAHYVANIVYENGMAKIANRRRIIPDDPDGCGVVEPQDFRDNDNEVTFFCGALVPSGAHLTFVYGYKIDSGRIVTYRRRMDEYNEPEGISPDGTWTTVECGIPDGPGNPPLDICRLELVPDGRRTTLVVGTAPGSTRKISQPVVSPDGKWIAFQAGDTQIGDPGEGLGIYRIRIAD